MLPVALGAGLGLGLPAAAAVLGIFIWLSHRRKDRADAGATGPGIDIERTEAPRPVRRSELPEKTEAVPSPDITAKAPVMQKSRNTQVFEVP